MAAPLAGLALLAGAQGCEPKGHPDRRYIPFQKNVFPENVGDVMYVGNIPNESIKALATGDMDGDGDMDIVAVSDGGSLYVVFNNIPQVKLE